LLDGGVVCKEGQCTSAGLDSITTLPNHGADRSATHIYELLDVFNCCFVAGYIHLMRPGKKDLEERSSSVGISLALSWTHLQMALTMLLEVLLRWGDQLDGCELVSVAYQLSSCDRVIWQHTHEPRSG